MTIHDSEIIRMARDGLDLNSIKAAVPVSYTTILEVCKQHGIPMEVPRGQQRRKRSNAPVLVVVRKERPDYTLLNQIKLAKKEEKPREQHHYDDARAQMTRLAFAEHVLTNENQLTTRNGIEFLAGKCATPALKMREANRVLKRMGLEQITGSPEWLV